MRNLTRREDARGRNQDDRDTNAAERLMVAGGEATDPQLSLWGPTGVSAHKAVALTKKEFEAWLVDLEVRAVASRLRRGR